MNGWLDTCIVVKYIYSMMKYIYEYTYSEKYNWFRNGDRSLDRCMP